MDVYSPRKRLKIRSDFLPFGAIFTTNSLLSCKAKLLFVCLFVFCNFKMLLCVSELATLGQLCIQAGGSLGMTQQCCIVN